MFGGSSNFKGINQDDDFIKVAETVVLQFGECSKYCTIVMWNCTLIATLAVVSKQTFTSTKDRYLATQIEIVKTSPSWLQGTAHLFLHPTTYPIHFNHAGGECHD